MGGLLTTVGLKGWGSESDDYGDDDSRDDGVFGSEWEEILQVLTDCVLLCSSFRYRAAWAKSFGSSWQALHAM